MHKIRVDIHIGVVVSSHAWVDGEGELYEEEIALGPIKMAAVRISGNEPVPPSNGELAEMFEPTILRLAKPVRDPGGVRRAVFRLQFETPEEAAAMYQDEAQRILDRSGGAVRIEVEPCAPPSPIALAAAAPPPGGEAYVQPSSLVQADDPAIAAAAREAIGEETEAWKAAKRLERWTHERIRTKSLGVVFASAKETLETREGDCTEHAALLVALCRAAGLPARAAAGLIYSEAIDGFGYHMWAEVYLDGWRDLDATRPGDPVDAMRIQLGASALEDARFASDLSVNLLKYLGRFSIEALQAER
ncbi:MAG: Transglutaminase-like superfamily protein [candidate division BRC1 bacterium ADurb.BinA364]|nr:MAG: Transglutaminase-like superfamily protein [candidate division BRC1 bacterium ADurb.BinA364]